MKNQKRRKSPMDFPRPTFSPSDVGAGAEEMGESELEKLNRRRKKRKATLGGFTKAVESVPITGSN